MTTLKEGKPEVRAKGHPLVRPDNYSHTGESAVFLYFEEKEGVGINIKAEMKGSALTESPRGSRQIMAQEYPLLPTLCNSCVFAQSAL